MFVEQHIIQCTFCAQVRSELQFSNWYLYGAITFFKEKDAV